MSALGALLLADADRLVRTASVAAALTVEAMLGTEVAFAAPYQLARPHPGQVRTAAELRHLLRDSGLQTRAPRVGAQGAGPVLAALRAAGARRRPRCAGPPAARAGRGAQLGHRQPARLPRGRLRPDRCPRDGRRPGDQRRQLPRRADRARARLREAGALGAGRHLGAADRADGGPAPQRRAAGVPHARSRSQQRPDDHAVHGGRPRVREQGLRAPVLGRLDPDLAPTRRTTCRWAPRRRDTRARCWGTWSRSSRSSCSRGRRRWTCGSMAPDGTPGGRHRPDGAGAGSGRRRGRGARTDPGPGALPRSGSGARP